VTGCAPSGSGGSPPDSSWPVEAPARTTVGGVGYSLEVEAWRSFQPITGDRGDPLLALVRLTSSQPIPADIALARVQLQRGADRWGGSVREESPRTGAPTTIDFMLRDGPRWAAGDSIGLLVEVVKGGSVLTVLGMRTVITRVE
jgi:hypothetical protein